MAERVEFKRNVGLFLAVMIGIGAMMGPGIFALPGELAHMVGPLGILVYLAMGVLTIFTALNYAELGAAIPIAGGGYSFTSRTLPRPVAFFTGWFFWIGNTLACALYAVIFALTVRTYFWPDASVALIVVATTVVFALINLRGMSEALVVITVMNLVELVILLGIAGLGIADVEPANLEPNGIQAFEVQFTAPAQTWHSAPVTVSGTINDPDCNTAPGVETVGVNDYTLSGGNGSWTFTKASVGAGRYAPARITVTSGCTNDTASAERSFGVDATGPTLLLTRLNQNGVDPDDVNTWPTVGAFGRLPLSARALDAVSGVRTLSALVENTDSEQQTAIFSQTVEVSGTPPLGASPVTVNACNVDEYCADNQLDLGSLTGAHQVLRVTLTDAAGNSTARDFYFVRQGLRDALLAWKASIPTDSDNGEARQALVVGRANLDAAVASFDAGAYGNIGLLDMPDNLSLRRGWVRWRRNVTTYAFARWPD